MKWKIGLALFFLLMVLDKPTAQPVNISESPVDILHYRLNLQFDWSSRLTKIDARVSMKFRQAVNSIRLNLKDVSVLRIKDHADIPIHYTIDTLLGYLNLKWDKKIRTGEKTDITITYETNRHNDPDPNAPGGSFGRGIRFFHPSTINPARRKQVWAQSDIVHTASWLPCNPDMSDASTMECIASMEPGFQFISNGKLVSKALRSDGWTTFHYKTEQPAPAYLTVIAAGVYDDLLQHVNGTTVHTFCYPDEREAAKATIVRFPDMLHFMEEKTGFAYPFTQYAQVMIQDYPFPGLAGQNTVSLISDNMIDDFGTHRDFLYLWDGVEMNALASQWFGNLIYPQSMSDLWLTRGFAQLFEGLYTASRNGEEEYLLWYHPFETSSVFGDWNNGNRHPIVPQSVEDPELFNTDSYSKYRGALVLRLLRLELGEATFFKTIRELFKKFAFQPVSTRQYQELVSRIAGKDMHWFFDQWIYHTGHPVFEFNQAYDSVRKKLKLQIRQVQQADTSIQSLYTGYFQGKMEVEIGDQKRIVQLLPRALNEFEFDLPAAPVFVNLDMHQQWIREIQMSRTSEVWLRILKDSRDVLAKNTALTELVSQAKESTITVSLRDSIVNALKQVLNSHAYWRFRFNAIGQLRQISPSPLDIDTRSLLVTLIKNENSWVKAAAISSLGMTKDSAYQDLYISCFNDTSDRVISAAAIALGKTKSQQAWEALLRLKERPSWKNQSLMHCLAGLGQLGNPEAEKIALAALQDVQSPRWFLGNGWDYPFVAVQTLSQLGRTEKAYALLHERFQLAMKEGLKEDIFYQVLLIATLGDSKGLEIFEPLKKRFSQDANAMQAINAYETQLRPAPADK